MTDNSDNTPNNTPDNTGETNPAPAPASSLASKPLAAPKKRGKNKDKAVKLNTGNEMSEFVRTAIIAIVLALAIRSLFFEPFNIPSSSMKPTLLVGDYLFVSKMAYGYSKYSFPLGGMLPLDGRTFYKKPKRGDVIVFKLPSNPNIDYIKRIVALPGETVQVKSGRLYINGERVEREPVGLKEVDKDYGGVTNMMEYIETLPGNVLHRIYEETDNGELDNTEIYTVPEKHFFVMGDNRDNSQDSRVSGLVGTVPYENIVGRADILFFSIDGTANLGKPWTWPGAIRYKRLFNTLGPVRMDDAS